MDGIDEDEVKIVQTQTFMKGRVTGRAAQKKMKKSIHRKRVLNSGDKKPESTLSETHGSRQSRHSPIIGKSAFSPYKIV